MLKVLCWHVVLSWRLDNKYTALHMFMFTACYTSTVELTLPSSSWSSDCWLLLLHTSSLELTPSSTSEGHLVLVLGLELDKCGTVSEEEETWQQGTLGNTMAEYCLVIEARAGSDQLLPSTPDQLCFITGYWHRMVQGAGYRGCSLEISRACRQSSSSESPGDLHCVRCATASCTQPTSPVPALCSGNFTQLKLYVIFTRFLYVYCVFYII